MSAVAIIQKQIFKFLQSGAFEHELRVEKKKTRNASKHYSTANRDIEFSRIRSPNSCNVKKSY